MTVPKSTPPDGVPAVVPDITVPPGVKSIPSEAVSDDVRDKMMNELTDLIVSWNANGVPIANGVMITMGVSARTLAHLGFSYVEFEATTRALWAKHGHGKPSEAETWYTLRVQELTDAFRLGELTRHDFEIGTLAAANRLAKEINDRVRRTESTS